ncbi:hypothetical protein [Mycoplasmopsis adleri]|uniref:hypothetical protein n=1 Tax=Mycoplasmopsis adleri TaxID=51362 RepID=UPI003872F838
MNQKWRFPSSNHGKTTGMSEPGTETFKQDPLTSFAREIVQNSIDARRNDDEPTKIIFAEFEINTDEIPGLAGLKRGIENCMEYWSQKPDYLEAYNKMLDLLKNKKIKCLRISDYNTTGLIGVNSTNPNKNNFLALVKGTGVSEKGTSKTAGGSKGIGKNALFLLSEIKTVLFSTLAIPYEHSDGLDKGWIGVAEFISGYIDDESQKNTGHILNEDRDVSQGTGFYSDSDKNNSIPELLFLDPSQKHRTNKTGTDIYIIGFEQENFEKETIKSILESFMYAIVNGELEIDINKIQINKTTLSQIIADINNDLDKRLKANILSQYKLMTGAENVSIYTIETDWGNCELRILPYNNDEKELATNQCTMIRYPWMKITDWKLGQNYNVSSLCIIDKGIICQKLRDIENPQHNKWEIKRLNNNKDLQRETNNLMKSIREQIISKVAECLGYTDEDQLDPNGASEFLPDIPEDNQEKGKNNKRISTVSESTSFSSRKPNITINKKPTHESDDDEGLMPTIGSFDEEETGNIQNPMGHNDSQSGDSHPGSSFSQEKEGDSITYKLSKLSGINYKAISTNKNEGKLRITFMSPDNYEKCYLKIFMLDDNNKKLPIKIINMKCNDAEIINDAVPETKSGGVFGPFNVLNHKKMIIDITTNQLGYFGSEVIIYACKE